jgi:hypothetical protein
MASAGDDDAASPKKTEKIEEWMEEKNLTNILQDFVVDCAKTKPDDIVSFMAEWALRQRPNLRQASPHPAPHPPSLALPAGAVQSRLPPKGASPSAGGSRRGSGEAGSPASPQVPRVTLRRASLDSLDGRSTPPLSLWMLPTASPATATNNPSPGGSMRSSLSGAPSGPYFFSTVSGLGSTMGSRPSSSSGRGGRPPLRGPRNTAVLVMAATHESKKPLARVFETLDVAPALDGDMALDAALGVVRQRIAAVDVSEDDVAVIPAGPAGSASPIVFMNPVGTAVDRTLVSLASAADAVVLVVSARSGAADMALKRQGTLYNLAMLAHSLGVKRAAIAVTETNGLPEGAVVAAELGATAMVERCGFAKGQVPTVRVPTTVEGLCGVVAALPITHRVTYVPEVTTKFKATLMLLNGGAVGVGDTLTAFSRRHFSCTVESIPSLIDRRTSKGSGQEVAAVQLHQIGAFVLTVNGTEPTELAIAAPMIVFKQGRLLAMGSVTDVDNDDEEDEEDEEFEVGA